MRPIYRYLIAGSLAGVANGLFGAGGGLFLVPLLIGWIGLEEKKAFATSIAIILPLSIVSYVLFCLNGGNVWADALPYLAGSAIGGFLAGKFGTRIPSLWLHKGLGLLILWGGVRYLC